MSLNFQYNCLFNCGDFRAVVRGTAGTAMAVPLFGPIMILKLHILSFDYHYSILLFSQFFFATKPK